MTDIKYIPFRSQISDHFWVEVHDRKLNQWGLDPTPHVVYGLLGSGNTESPILRLDRWSFSAEECYARSNVNSTPICGTLLMVESISEFKQISKQALLNSDGHSLWNAYISSVGPVPPEYGVRFLILCFANMKDNSTVYWVSYPSILIQHEVGLNAAYEQKNIPNITRLTANSLPENKRKHFSPSYPFSMLATYDSYLQSSLRILTKSKSASNLQTVLPRLSSQSVENSLPIHAISPSPPPAQNREHSVIEDLYRLHITGAVPWIRTIENKSIAPFASDSPVRSTGMSRKDTISPAIHPSDAHISSDEYYCFLLAFAVCIKRRKRSVSSFFGVSRAMDANFRSSSSSGEEVVSAEEMGSSHDTRNVLTPSSPLVTVLLPSELYKSIYDVLLHLPDRVKTENECVADCTRCLPAPAHLPIFALKNGQDYVCLSFEEVSLISNVLVSFEQSSEGNPFHTSLHAFSNSSVLSFTNLVSHSMDPLSNMEGVEGKVAFPWYFRSIFSLVLIQAFQRYLKLHFAADSSVLTNQLEHASSAFAAFTPRLALSFAPNFAILQQVYTWLEKQPSVLDAVPGNDLGTALDHSEHSVHNEELIFPTKGAFVFHNHSDESFWEKIRENYLQYVTSVFEVCPYRFVDHSQVYSLRLAFCPTIQSELMHSFQSDVLVSDAMQHSSESLDTVPSTDTQVSLPNVHTLTPSMLPTLPAFLTQGWAHLLSPYSECTMPSGAYPYQTYVRHRLPMQCLVTGWEMGDKGKPAPKLSRIPLIQQPSTTPGPVLENTPSSTTAPPVGGGGLPRPVSTAAAAVVHLAADAVSTSTDLNLSLMKWRLLPELNKTALQNCRVLLLGAGTLGCFVSRFLLGWGIQNITLVDNGKVSFSNLTRQPLYDIYDAISNNYATPSEKSNHNGILYMDHATDSDGRSQTNTDASNDDGGIKASYKALAAADSLRRIQPGANVTGIVMNIPMPGAASNPKIQETPILVTRPPGVSVFPPDFSTAAHNQADRESNTRTDASPEGIDDSPTHLEALTHLIRSHDVVFLLTDSRESRWTPTFLGALLNVPTFTVALGFDSLIVVRHGVQPEVVPGDTTREQSAPPLGCYFCIDPYAVPGTRRRVVHDALDEVQWLDEPAPVSTTSLETNIPLPLGADPTNGAMDPSMDQKCTVTRPAVAPIASAVAVELLVSLLHHPERFYAPHETDHGLGSGTKSPIGTCPHIFRFFLSHFTPIQGAVAQAKQCSACSPLAFERILSTSGTPESFAPAQKHASLFNSTILSSFFTEDGGRKLYDVIWSPQRVNVPASSRKKETAETAVTDMQTLPESTDKTPQQDKETSSVPNDDNEKSGIVQPQVPHREQTQEKKCSGSTNAVMEKSDTTQSGSSASAVIPDDAKDDETEEVAEKEDEDWEVL